MRMPFTTAGRNCDVIEYWLVTVGPPLPLPLYTVGMTLAKYMNTPVESVTMRVVPSRGLTMPG